MGTKVLRSLAQLALFVRALLLFNSGAMHAITGNLDIASSPRVAILSCPTLLDYAPVCPAVLHQPGDCETLTKWLPEECKICIETLRLQGWLEEYGDGGLCRPVPEKKRTKGRR